MLGAWHGGASSLCPNLRGAYDKPNNTVATNDDDGTMCQRHGFAKAISAAGQLQNRDNKDGHQLSAGPSPTHFPMTSMMCVAGVVQGPLHPVSAFEWPHTMTPHVTNVVQVSRRTRAAGPIMMTMARNDISTRGPRQLWEGWNNDDGLVNDAVLC